MSIRYGLLALLSEDPLHGYQLRQTFEERTGGTWPLNIGQVYTTLRRLERDGLVIAVDADAEDEGRQTYALTRKGRAEVADWFSAPVIRDQASRDELTIKIALAMSAPGVDVASLVQKQRTETMRTLQNYTRLKTHADNTELAWRLALDSLLFHAEAELRWLDHCEQTVLTAAARPQRGSSAVAGQAERRRMQERSR
jgi:DNA-binding PadR family transcriptional regulator